MIWLHSTEMKFLDISLTKDSSLLLHAIRSVSTGGFKKKTRLYSGFKNTRKKIRETRKLELYSWIAFYKKTRQILEFEKIRVYA